MASSPNVTSISSNATSIALTWTQSLGEVVDQYIIAYSFTERDCGFSGSNSVRLSGLIRSYRQADGVQENSDYTVGIIAKNAAGNSTLIIASVTTAAAGNEYYYYIKPQYLFNH